MQAGVGAEPMSSQVLLVRRYYVLACTKLIRTWSIPGAEQPRHHLSIDIMAIDGGPCAWNKSKSHIKQSIEVGVRGKM